MAVVLSINCRRVRAEVGGSGQSNEKRSDLRSILRVWPRRLLSD